MSKLRSSVVVSLVFLAAFTGLIAQAADDTSATAPDVVKILSGAAMRLDASVEKSFVLDASGNVTAWRNMSPSGRALYGNATANGAYGTRTTASWKGADVPVYDMGGAKSNVDLTFKEIAHVQTVFWVGDFAKDGIDYAPLLGHSSDCGLHRGANGEFVSSAYSEIYKAADHGHLAFYLNSKTTPEADCGTKTCPNTGSVDIIAMTCDGNDHAKFNQLGRDRGYGTRSGGRKLCEVIIFTRALTTEEFAAVYDYLDEKWNHGGWESVREAATQTWTGETGDGKWSTAGNWDADVPTANDTVVFANETDVSTVYDLFGMMPADMRKSGDGILTISDFGAALMPLVMTGGGIVLTGDVPTSNPFSTAKDELHLNGLFGLGGVEQTLYVSAGKWLADGEKIVVTNGTLTIDVGSTGTYSDFYGDLVALKGGTINHNARLRLMKGNGTVRLLADGGTINHTGSGGAYIGTDNYNATGVVEVVNGGLFYAPRELTFGGHVNKGTAGKLLVSSGGTADFGTSKLIFGKDEGSMGVLRLENGTLRAGELSMPSSKAIVDAVFDAATVVATAAKDPFVSTALAESPFRILSGGLTLDNSGYNIGIAATFFGEGGLTLAGAGRTTFSKPQTFAGDLRVGADTTLVLKYGASTFAGDVVFAAGAKLDLEISADGIATLAARSVDFSALTVEHPLVLTLTESAAPEAGVNYCVLAMQERAVTEEDLAKIVLPPGMTGDLAGGVLSVRMNPKTTVWTGKAGDGKWSTDGNWSDGHPADYDSVVFDSEATESNFDLAGIKLSSILFGANAGAFALGGSEPLTVLFTVSNLAANVQSFAMPVVGGVAFTDLYASADGGLAFDGGFTGGIQALRKRGDGAVTIRDRTPQSPLDFTEGSIFLSDLESSYRTDPFSSAQNALHLNGSVDFGGASQTMNVTAEKWLADGEEIVVTNGTLTLSAGGLGNYTDFFGDLTVLRGGTINHNGRLRLRKTNGTIRLLADGGTINHNGTTYSGYVGIDWDNATGIVEVAHGGRFTSKQEIVFGGSGGKKTVGKLLVSSDGSADFGSSDVVLGRDADATGILRIENGTLCAAYVTAPHANATVDALFDNATFIATADTADCFSSVHAESPYVIGDGGLIVSNVGHTVGFRTALRGTGAVTLAGGGRFTFAEDYVFPADVVVDGAQLVDPPTGEVQGARIFSARGEISGYPEGKDAYGNRFYVTKNDGVSTLKFGHRRGLLIIIK